MHKGTTFFFLGTIIYMNKHYNSTHLKKFIDVVYRTINIIENSEIYSFRLVFNCSEIVFALTLSCICIDNKYTYKNNISVPKDSMDIINRAFRNGTTIWHNHNNLGNYSLSNNIVQ